MAEKDHPVGAAARFEAEARKRMKPVLSPEEQLKEDQEAIRSQLQWAAARDRDVAENLLARAKAREAEAMKVGKGGSA